MTSNSNYENRMGKIVKYCPLNWVIIPKKDPNPAECGKYKSLKVPKLELLRKDIHEWKCHNRYNRLASTSYE